MANETEVLTSKTEAADRAAIIRAIKEQSQSRETKTTTDVMNGNANEPQNGVTNGGEADDIASMDSLSKKIEDEMRLLDWEMTSSVQDDVISDVLGTKWLTDLSLDFETKFGSADSKGHLDESKGSSTTGNKMDVEDRKVVYAGVVANGHVEFKKGSLGTVKSRRSKKHVSSRKRTGSSQGKDVTSSVSSMSSTFEDAVENLDDEKGHFSDGSMGDIENNTTSSRSSSTSNEYGVEFEEERQNALPSVAHHDPEVFTDDLDKVAKARYAARIDQVARVMTNSIIRDVAVIFRSENDADYWKNMFMVDTTLEQFHFDPHQIGNVDKETEIVFAKKFGGTDVIFADLPVFSFDVSIVKRSDAREGAVKVDYIEHDAEGDRTFQRARFQMHDIQHQLRLLKQQMQQENDSYLVHGASKVAI